jgi:hypothetical protein
MGSNSTQEPEDMTKKAYLLNKPWTRFGRYFCFEGEGRPPQASEQFFFAEGTSSAAQQEGNTKIRRYTSKYANPGCRQDINFSEGRQHGAPYYRHG